MTLATFTDSISKKSRLKRGAEDSAPDMSHEEDSDSENHKMNPGSEHLAAETNMSCDDDYSNSENSSHSGTVTLFRIVLQHFTLQH